MPWVYAQFTNETKRGGSVHKGFWLAEEQRVHAWYMLRRANGLEQALAVAEKLKSN